MPSPAVTPLARSLVLGNSQLGERLPHAHGSLSVLVRINIQMAMSSPMLKPSSFSFTIVEQGKSILITKGLQHFGEERKDWMASLQRKMHCIFTSSELAFRRLFGRRLQKSALCCPAQRGMDGNVKKVFSSLNWSLCHRYRQDSYTGILWVRAGGHLPCYKALQACSVVSKLLQSL